jgi:uncharacterized protein (UPF0264 family)
MTGMLASVTSPEEAQIVLQAGADIIDLKDPARGALGARPAAVIQAIVTRFSSSAPLSATIGDLPMQPQQICSAVAATAGCGVDYVKIGVFADPQQADCIRALRPLCEQGIRIVIVMFADRNPDPDLLPLIAATGCVGAMLDTADKHAGGLRSCLDPQQLADFVAKSKALNLLTGLAGSLRAGDIAPLLTLAPDYLGFRGALCSHGERTTQLDPAAVTDIRAQIPKTPIETAVAF